MRLLRTCNNSYSNLKLIFSKPFLVKGVLISIHFLLQSLNNVQANLFVDGLSKIDRDTLCLPSGPCSCSITVNNNNLIHCESKVQRIYDAFHAIEPISMDELIVLFLDDTVIPDDFLGPSTATALTINGKRESGPELIIAKSAFQSSAIIMNEFSLNGFNARHLDWSFLGEFTHLDSFELSYIGNTGNMTRTLAQFNPGLRELDFFLVEMIDDIPNAPKYLERARFRRCSLNSNSTSLSNILTRLMPASTVLRVLEFSKSPLVEVPRELKVFRKLKFLDLSYTGLSVLRSGDFEFDDGPIIHLHNNNITKIEPGVFDDKDSFSNASIHLYWNPLETLDENVFKVFLENNGQLWILPSNLTCGCDIAWLVVQRRELLKNVYAECRNGTNISELHAEEYKHCFVLKEIASPTCSVYFPLFSRTEPSTVPVCTVPPKDENSSRSKSTGHSTIITVVLNISIIAINIQYFS